MNVKDLILGASLGLLSAAILIGGISLAGTDAQHIDLVPTTSAGHATQSGTGVATQGIAPSTSFAQPGAQGSNTGQQTATSRSSGVSLLRLIAPILLAIVLGAAFYGLYTRRLDAE